MWRAPRRGAGHGAIHARKSKRRRRAARGRDRPDVLVQQLRQKPLRHRGAYGTAFSLWRVVAFALIAAPHFSFLPEALEFAFFDADVTNGNTFEVAL